MEGENDDTEKTQPLVHKELDDLRKKVRIAFSPKLVEWSVKETLAENMLMAIYIDPSYDRKYKEEINSYFEKFTTDENRDRKIKNRQVDNRRLSTLGINTLSTIITEYLFLEYNEDPTTEMLNKKSNLICKESCNLYYKTLKIQIPTLKDTSIDLKRSKRELTKDPFEEAIFLESLIGALFISFGYEAIKNFTLEYILLRDIVESAIVGKYNYINVITDLLKEYRLPPIKQTYNKTNSHPIKICCNLLWLTKKPIATSESVIKEEATTMAYKKLYFDNKFFNMANSFIMQIDQSVTVYETAPHDQSWKSLTIGRMIDVVKYFPNCNSLGVVTRGETIQKMLVARPSDGEEIVYINYVLYTSVYSWGAQIRETGIAITQSRATEAAWYLAFQRANDYFIFREGIGENIEEEYEIGENE